MKSAEEIFRSVSRERAVCARCGLSSKCGSPYMQGRGNKERPIIAVVGEAPGATDIVTGYPFSGPPGEVLRMVARDYLGLVVNESLFVTNAVRCKPPDKLNKTHINACREFVIDELFAVNPKVIVAMGNGALESLTGRTGIMVERGILSVIRLRSSWGEEREFQFIPTVHPNYVMRNPSALDYLALDFKNAKSVAEGEALAGFPETDYRIVRDRKDIKALRAEVKKAKRVAWDTETSGINPFVRGASIICVSVSTKPGTGWLIPLDHAECVSMESSLSERIDLVRWILTESGKPLVGQNLKFDSVWVTEHLLFRPNPPAFDSYIAHHLLHEDESEAGGNGLKAMAWKYTQMGGYERPLETRYPDMYQRMKTLPLEDDNLHETLTWYACADVDVALQIQDALLPMLKQQNLLGVMEELENEKSEFLVDLELQGQAIDWEYQRELEQRFPETIDKCLHTLREYDCIKKLETKFARRKYKGDDSGDMFGGKTVPFNPNSTDQVSMLCLDILGLPALTGKGQITKTGKQSVGKDSMADWIEMSQGETREVLEAITEYKSLQKLYSAYVKALPEHKCKDGKVHARFNGAKVVTWRLSAEDPNVMQLPRADDGAAEGEVGKGDIKRMYISAFPNGFVMEADYSQIELRIAALISQDKAMIDEYWREDNDLHRKTAAAINYISEDEVTDVQRSYAKAVNFGIIYGMQARTLAARTGVDEYTAQRWLDGFEETYFGFFHWVKQTREFALRHGYVESLFGHRRHLPNLNNPWLREEALRQAQNSPIQNTASNLTIYAGMYLNKLLREDGYESRIFSQVHDSLQLTGPMSEADKVAELTTLVMENMPFDFLTGDDPRFPAAVPIVAEVKIGPNLRDMKKI